MSLVNVEVTSSVEDSILSTKKKELYDATFTGWWQWLEVIILEYAKQELSNIEGKNVSIDATTIYARTKVATSICSTAQKYCVGVLQQYQNDKCL